MDFNLKKIDFNVFHGFLRDNASLKRTLRVIKEGKLV